MQVKRQQLELDMEKQSGSKLGKIRDLFKKISDTKGILHAKIGTMMERNCMDLTEAEDMKKRWQEYTEELYKKDFHDLSWTR